MASEGKSERRGVGRRLTDGQRVEIIKLFESGAGVTEADVARRYGVTRSAIWRLRRASAQIMERYQEGDIESRDERRRGASASASTSSSASPATTSAGFSSSAAAPTSAATVAAMAHNHAIAVSAAAMNGASVNTMARSGLLDAGSGQPASMGEHTSFQGVSMGLARPMAPVVGGHLVLSGGGTGPDMVVMPDGSTLPLVPEVRTQQATVTTGQEMTVTPAASTDAALPLVFLSMRSIGSVQSPGIVNWERVGGAHDDEHFEIVNDGLCVRREGGYQLNVDVQHSQPRQNFRCSFKVWHDKKLLGQCACPLRTKKEVSLSVLELRCRLPALAKLRVEFLAPGFAFHETRATIRLLPLA